MMTRILTILLLALGSIFSLAQDAGEGGSKLVVDRNLHDFGDIDKGKKVTTTFSFKNEGTEPLEIINVATSCGCTSAKPEKAVYNPGEAGEIPVTFDSTRFSGPITKRVTIHTNDKASPKTVVTIKGNVVVEVNAKPTSLFFAKAKMGEKTSQDIEVSTEKLAKLEISDLEIAPSDYLSVEMKRVDDKNVKLVVTADGNKFPTGKARLNGTLSYKTNSETQGDMRSIITIHVERPIRVSPNSVYFFASKAGQKRESILRLISTEDVSFDVKEIKSDLEYVTVEVSEDEGKTKSLKVVLAASAPEGKFQGSVTIKTSIAAQPEVVIPIRGSVIK